MLRQQLAVLKRRHRRPNIGLLDKLFWVIVRRFWSGWKQALIVVTPETVVRWHRTGFRMYWRLISRVRTQVGRRRTPKQVKEVAAGVAGPGWVDMDPQFVTDWRHFRQPEVENLGVAALGDKDVRRLDVTMYDTFPMCRIQRIGNLDGQRKNH